MGAAVGLEVSVPSIIIRAGCGTGLKFSLNVGLDNRDVSPDVREEKNSQRER